MTAICAKKTAGVDVERPLRITLGMWQSGGKRTCKGCEGRLGVRPEPDIPVHYRDLGHLEREIARVADDLRADPNRVYRDLWE